MRHLLTFAATLALASPTLANDTTASSPVGGLVLQRTDAIDMVAEDLFVSADQIRVHYVFRNRTSKDVETVVAFPMPDRDLGEEYGGDVAYPSGFHTIVEGKPVTAKLERKATVKARDVTAELSRPGIPLAPDRIDAATQAMDRLSPAEKKRLVALGVATFNAGRLPSLSWLPIVLGLLLRGRRGRHAQPASSIQCDRGRPRRRGRPCPDRAPRRSLARLAPRRRRGRPDRQGLPQARARRQAADPVQGASGNQAGPHRFEERFASCTRRYRPYRSGSLQAGHRAAG